MSDHATFPAEGINHLVIEEMTRDALVGGTTDTQAIEVTCEPVGRDTTSTLAVEGDVARLEGAPAERIILPNRLAITVKNVPGDLRVQDLSGDVNLESVHGDLRLAGLGGVVRVAQVNGSIRAEGVTDLRLMGSCDGDLRTEHGEHLEAEAVAGDVRLHHLADARLGRVRGDLWVEKVEGALQVNRADGDARLSEIGGPVAIRTLTGDLRASSLTNGLTVQRVNGNALLSGPFSGADGYAILAEGDISLHLPSDSDVRLTLRAGGRIRSDPQLTPAGDGSPTFTANLGRGTSRITLESGGDLRITQNGMAHTRAGGGTGTRTTADSMSDLSNLGERIRQQVSASLAAAGISIAGDESTWSRRGRSGTVGPRAPRPHGPERPRSANVSAAPSMEEQVAVMKMLAEGKISPEEADVLLSALGA
jgi:hypothetical protein